MAYSEECRELQPRAVVRLKGHIKAHLLPEVLTHELVHLVRHQGLALVVERLDGLPRLRIELFLPSPGHRLLVDAPRERHEGAVPERVGKRLFPALLELVAVLSVVKREECQHVPMINAPLHAQALASLPFLVGDPRQELHFADECVLNVDPRHVVERVRVRGAQLMIELLVDIALVLAEDVVERFPRRDVRRVEEDPERLDLGLLLRRPLLEVGLVDLLYLLDLHALLFIVLFIVLEVDARVHALYRI
mmetsp:Transcript_16553/g.38631  ORF Transcript_16553/g.38631 Transcript_16553/m.38631 type:complete len:249 (-) Transcript_16553:1564-2310(-)